MRHGVAGVSIGLAAVLVACSTDPGVHVVERQVAQGFDGVPITIDDATTLLTLDNGLTVYLRHNERPGSSADIRLAIDAGSAMETPEQSGVAHFLEHMMFNGTEQFPANELVDVLRGFGMEFGADLNAYTSYDETVYQLTVPLADPASLGTGLDVAQQWLSAASLDEAAVAAERGVVLDEWRVREQSFDGRESVALYGMMLDGTSYADRAPIGVQQAIESMTAAPLRDFYDTWYRPDNAALVVVGDIDIDEVESLVRDRFEGLGPRGDIVEPPTTALGALGETKVTVFSDPDTLQMSAALMYPALQAPPATTADLRRAFLPGLAFDMIATRLSDDAVRGTAEFRTADSYSLDPVRPLAVPAVWLEADPSAAAATIDSLMVEFERVARYGFDDNELQRALDGYRSAVESAHESRDTVQDYRYADDMVDHYLMGASISSADFEYETWMTILDSVTATDVNLAIDLLVEASAPNLFVSVPDGTEVPSEADLAAALAALATRDIEPREQTAAAGDELMAAPEPVEEETDEAYLSEPGFYLDSHRLVFPNGAVVILNATDIVAESVVIEAQSPGGLSALPDSDVWAARYAPDVAAGSGVGGLDQVAVDGVLGGADVSMYPYIDTNIEGFSGSSSSADLELAFQLMHLYMTEPGFTQSALDAVKEEDQPYIDDPLADPDFASYDALIRARYGSDPRFMLVPSAAEMEALGLAAVERTFRERFSNASDWVFVLSGDFDEQTAADLARRYIGTLTGDGSAESYGAPPPLPPVGVADQVVRTGTGETASLTIWFEEPADGSQYEAVQADLLTQVLTNRFTTHIREELGASYSPQAGTWMAPFPANAVVSYAYVSGAPDDMDRLVQVVHDDLAALAASGPAEEELAAAIAVLENEYNLFSNEQLVAFLLDPTADEQQMDTFYGRYRAASSFSAADMAAFAARVLRADHYVQVVQLPA